MKLVLSLAVSLIVAFAQDQKLVAEASYIANGKVVSTSRIGQSVFDLPVGVKDSSTIVMVRGLSDRPAPSLYWSKYFPIKWERTTGTQVDVIRSMMSSCGGKQLTLKTRSMQEMPTALYVWERKNKHFYLKGWIALRPTRNPNGLSKPMFRRHYDMMGDPIITLAVTPAKANP